MNFKRYLTCSLLAVAAATPAQTLFESWRQVTPSATSLSAAAFGTDSRTFHVQETGSGSNLVARAWEGTLLWSTPLPISTASMILSTTDNLVYIIGKRISSGNDMVVCYDVDGDSIWLYEFTNGLAPSRRFTDMRIVGNSLLVCGSGRTGVAGTDSRTVLFSINRFNGVPSYAREYLFGSTNIAENQKLRLAGGNAFVMATRNSSTGILKINPANGDVLGTYAVTPFYAKDFQVDSTSGLFITGYQTHFAGAAATETRKVNGAGSGSFPLVYRRTYGGDRLMLSAGHIYMDEPTTGSLRKVRAWDGSQVWQRPFPPGSKIDDIRADASGRLYTLSSRTVNTEVENWSVNIIDPVTGSDLDTYTAAEGTPTTKARSMSINSYGEVFAVGSEANQGVAVRLYQPMEPVDDVYTMIQGTTLSTNGQGVLKNDKYTNPHVTVVSRVTNSGPSSGNLNLQANGEFTYSSSSWEGLPVGVQTFRYRATRGSVTAEAQVTIHVVRALRELRLTRSYSAGNAQVGGTVYLTSTTPDPAVVSLSDDSPHVTVPATVTVQAGQVSRAFAFQTTVVTTRTIAYITATYGGVSKTVPLDLQPIDLATFGTSPGYQIRGGNNVRYTLTLNGSALSPVSVALSSNKPWVQPPASVNFPVGENFASFDVPTSTPPTVTMVTLTAAGNGVTLTRSLRVDP